jgi:hypothetical protein
MVMVYARLADARRPSGRADGRDPPDLLGREVPGSKALCAVGRNGGRVPAGRDTGSLVGERASMRLPPRLMLPRIMAACRLIRRSRR